MSSKIENLITGLPDGFDGILIRSRENRLYFTGMQSSAGTLLCFRDGAAYFIIDFRYFERAQASVKNCEVILQGKLYEQINKLTEKHAAKKIAVEGGYMTLSVFEQYQANLSAQLVADDEVDRAIRSLRMHKSPQEISLIRQAQEITDLAFTHICSYIRPGMTERQIAGELLNYCYLHGSQGPSFDYIVVSGENSSLPHGVPGERLVQAGDFITMDFGCIVDGYCSDMTRTVGIGKVSDEQRAVYEIVLAAQKNALQAVRSGAICRDVDAAARDLIAKEGYRDCFGHGTGHSVGIEIHEQPAFNTADTTACASGMVMTVEPGIYLAGKFGVRIEDMVVITQDGAENLTKSDKSLRLL